jgi:hypothetical protein
MISIIQDFPAFGFGDAGEAGMGVFLAGLEEWLQHPEVRVNVIHTGVGAISEGDVMLLDEEMTEWVLARVRGEKRRSHEQTPASSALWRAYRALSAARYHLQDQPIEAKIRDIREEIEVLWRETSPLHEEKEEAMEEELEEAS